jgi:DMSO/TMAO reductase YedYZ heme-binding membrane subunit
MVFDTSFVLFLLLLAFVVAHLLPKPVGWGRLAVWAALALLTVVLVLVHAIHFMM